MVKLEYPFTIDELNQLLNDPKHSTLTTAILYLTQELRHMSNTLDKIWLATSAKMEVDIDG